MANTLYDFYTQQGKTLPSLTERAKLYEIQGLGSATTYQGTAEQNTSLLGKLQTTPTLGSIETGLKEVQTQIPKIEAGIAELPPKPIPSEVNARDIGLGTAEITVPTGGTGDNTNAFNQSLQVSLDASKKAYEDMMKKQMDDLAKKKTDYETKISDLETKQSVMMETDIKPLMEPFRQKLEETERTRLQVEKNYFANQKSITELSDLLTIGQTEIQALKNTPGLSVIKSGQITKKQEDISARAGVLQAVMSARNGQIHEAYTLIDRTAEAITNDRKDKLSYYQSVYNIAEKKRDEYGNKLITLDKDEKDYVNQQISDLKTQQNLDQAAITQIKEAMTNPKTASVYEQAGVKLTDTVAEIQKKLADYSYRQEGIEINNTAEKAGYNFLATPELVALKEKDPNVEIMRQTDSKGKEYVFWKEKTKTTAEVKAEEPLSILDVGRYQEAYPDAGVVAGDTEKTANEKVLKSTQPREFTEEELKSQFDSALTEKISYEQVISDIDANTLIANKDLAKKVAAEVYGVKEKTIIPDLEAEIKSLKRGGVLTNQDIRSTLRKRWTDEQINNSSLGRGNIIDQISDWLFR